MELVVDHVPVKARRERAIATDVAASFATEVAHTLDPYPVPVACQLITMRPTETAARGCCKRFVFQQTVPIDLSCTTYEAEDTIAVGPRVGPVQRDQPPRDPAMCFEEMASGGGRRRF